LSYSGGTYAGDEGVPVYDSLHRIEGAVEATSPLPEILVLETTLGLGGRPPLDAAFVAVCDTVLMAWKGERRSPLPTLLSDSASARLTQSHLVEYILTQTTSCVMKSASMPFKPLGMLKHFRRPDRRGDQENCTA
jgi:hypothetical protein